MTTTIEVLKRLNEYSSTLPKYPVCIQLAHLVLGDVAPYEIELARMDIKEIYGDSSKVPVWLQIIASAQPGKIEQACAEARVHLADELDTFEEMIK
jgi:hypothetical protein